jgi:hypothetical protein
LSPIFCFCKNKKMTSSSVEMWQGCCIASALAWGPFWPPVPRPRLLPELPPAGLWVGFPFWGGVWAEWDRMGVFGGEQEGGGVLSEWARRG